VTRPRRAARDGFVINFVTDAVLTDAGHWTSFQRGPPSG
jgi:hypothetical protein